MSIFRPGTRDPWGLSRRSQEEEWLDSTGLSQHVLGRNLAEMAATNRLLRWTALTLRYVQQLTSGCPATEPLYVLDVATGSADVPRALVTWARQTGRPIAIAAVDLSPAVLAVARPSCTGYPEITLIEADALHLPCADGSVDIALCSLALHHFAPEDAVIALRELARVSRRGIVVCDLERSLFGYLGALALSLLWRSPLTRHDGPLSVRRAYTRAEIHALLDRAGLSRLHVTRHFPCRIVAWGRL